MNISNPRIALAAALFLFTVASCKKEDNDPPAGNPQPFITTDTVINRSITDFNSGPLNATQAVYFNFRTGQEVPVSEVTAGNWDISFKRSEIRINSGVSGSGNAGLVVLEEDTGNFKNERYAPESGYKKDGEGPDDETGIGATKGLVFNNWYNYDSRVNPKPDRIYFLRTADNHYVKLIITGYYSSVNPESGGFYSFTYAYQPGGSKDLKFPD